MTLILLEALGAALLLVFIVWWTMFSGRRGGEPEPPDETVEPGELGDQGSGEGVAESRREAPLPADAQAPESRGNRSDARDDPPTR